MPVPARDYTKVFKIFVGEKKKKVSGYKQGKFDVSYKHLTIKILNLCLAYMIRLM